MNPLLFDVSNICTTPGAVGFVGVGNRQIYWNNYRGKLNNMLARLLVEHDHILKTLNLLEMQFMDLCRGGTPDYSLMRSILVYIQEYPEQVHHPLEDKIFSILLERVDEVKLIQELIAEHAELEIATRKLSESAKLLEAGVGSKEEIKKQLSSFLIRQRQHMYIEEETVHPLIESALTEEDWSYVQSAVPLYKSK